MYDRVHFVEMENGVRCGMSHTKTPIEFDRDGNASSVVRFASPQPSMQESKNNDSYRYTMHFIFAVRGRERARARVEKLH